MLFVGLVLGTTSVLMILRGAWLGLLVNSMVVGFMIYLCKTTYYTIDGNDLNVKSGFLIQLTIPIESIRKIAETNSLLSAPAMSLDRLEIYYRKTDSVIISPKDKIAFINHLKSIHPLIEVEWKHKK